MFPSRRKPPNGDEKPPETAVSASMSGSWRILRSSASTAFVVVVSGVPTG
jgi:hypothetical protein